MNDITQYTDISRFLTMAFAGVVMINMMCLVFALVLKFAKVLRVSVASFIAALTTSWLSWIFLTAFLPTKMMNAGWAAGLFFLSLILVYVIWLFIFQPHSLESMLKMELYQKQCKRFNQQIAQCKDRLKVLDKSSDDYNNTVQEIKSLKNEKSIAKLEILSIPLKILGKKLCRNSK